MTAVELINILTFLSSRPRLLLTGFFRHFGVFTISLCLTLSASFLYVKVKLPVPMLAVILLVVFLLSLYLNSLIFNKSQTSLVRVFCEYLKPGSGVDCHGPLAESAGDPGESDTLFPGRPIYYSRKKIRRAMECNLLQPGKPERSVGFEAYVRALGLRSFVYQVLVNLLLFAPFLAVTLLLYPGGESGLLLLLLFLGLLFLNFLSAALIEPLFLLWIQNRIFAFSRRAE